MSLSRYTVVYCEKQLQTGDHISWTTEQISGISNHHAIVVAPKGKNTFKVIHVVNDVGDGYSSASYRSPTYFVREEIIDFSQQMSNGTLCCYDYEPRQCNEPVEVIQYARRKIGRFDYDALNNNSEHFVRSCKTGIIVTIPFLLKLLLILSCAYIAIILWYLLC